LVSRSNRFLGFSEDEEFCEYLSDLCVGRGLR
jgi:hypothetical protein